MRRDIKLTFFYTIKADNEKDLDFAQDRLLEMAGSAGDMMLWADVVCHEGHADPIKEDSAWEDFAPMRCDGTRE